MFQLFQRPTCPLLRDSSDTTNITLFFKLSCYLRHRDDTFRSRSLFSRRRRFSFGPIRLVRIFGAATALSGGRNVLPDCPRSGFETILHFSYLWCRNGTFRRSERFVRLPAIRFWNRPAFFVSLQRINPYDMAFFDIFKKKQDTPPTGEQAQKQQEELSRSEEHTSELQSPQ